MNLTKEINEIVGRESMRMNMTMSMRFSSNLRRVFSRDATLSTAMRAPHSSRTAYHLVRVAISCFV